VFAGTTYLLRLYRRSRVAVLILLLLGVMSLAVVRNMAVYSFGANSGSNRSIHALARGKYCLISAMEPGTGLTNV
jgi:hypothetical protein